MEYNIAICGATGVVGRTVLKILEQKNLSAHNYTLFASKKSKGKKLKIADITYRVKELCLQNLEQTKFDFALFCTGEDVSKLYVKKLAQRGTVVIDFSSLYRKKYPLIVPEINFNKAKGNIICNPNCSTIAAVTSLHNIHKTYGISKIIYSTYQALSGAGLNALKDKKTTNPKKLKKLDFVINNNILPTIGEIKKTGYTKEEEKMIYETKKILGDKKIKISATCIRVPIDVCHSESINFTTRQPARLKDIKKCLQTTDGARFVANQTNMLMPLYVGGKDEVFVGRLRKGEENTFNIFVVSDNLRKGAALNGVQILERLMEAKNDI